MRNAVGRVQSALVLGATSEIAAAICEGLAHGGCRRFVLAARHPSDLDDLEQRLRDAGAAAVQRLAFDAADPSGHDALVQAAFLEGDLDLVLFAFGQLGDSDTTQDPASAVELVEVNFVGAVSLGLRVLRHLRAQGHGTMVVLSSVAGERVRASNYLYGSTKAGLDGFFLGLADAERRHGVRVMVVRPGFAATRMTAGLDPAPLATSPERIARDVVRGLERGSEIVWSPPALRLVMSGLRHLPRAVFRRLPL